MPESYTIILPTVVTSINVIIVIERESLLSHAVARGISDELTGGIEKVGSKCPCSAVRWRGEVQAREVEVTKATIAHWLKQKEGGREGEERGYIIAILLAVMQVQTPIVKSTTVPKNPLKILAQDNHTALVRKLM